MENTHTAFIKVSVDFLENLLLLPKDHHIKRILRNDHDHDDIYRFVIDGPDMPESDGNMIQCVMLKYRKDADGKVELVDIRREDQWSGI